MRSAQPLCSVRVLRTPTRKQQVAHVRKEKAMTFFDRKKKNKNIEHERTDIDELRKTVGQPLRPTELKSVLGGEAMPARIDEISG